jgi:hypothetical protein
MKNLTLAIEEDLLIEARKLALDRGTTVNQMVRDHLIQVVREHGEKEGARRRLSQAMEKGLGVVGEIGWTREDLHER